MNTHKALSFIILCFFIKVTSQNTSTTSAKPDYKNITNWAAHPLKEDPSDILPEFTKSEIRDSSIDVFFIHPTSYLQNLRTKEWNANINNKEVNKATDEGSITYQASVFNQHGRIFAPRYRQAHIKAFLLPKNPMSKKALDLAYEDVKSAFIHFLKYENHGRPFILASHSQGTYHAIKLMEEFIDDDTLADKMICAYLVGWAVYPETFDEIKPCTTATQVGGFVSWRSFRHGNAARYVKMETAGALCTNPISWKTNYNKTETDEHKGALGKNINKLYVNSLETEVSKEFPILWVTPKGELAQVLGNTENYHLIDYNLFYMDIRQNVHQRVSKYFEDQSK